MTYTVTFLGAEIEGPFKLVALYVLTILAGFATGAFAVWGYAPPVGGAFWPYIHALISLVGGIATAWVAAIVFVFAVIVAVSERS
jgi:hypothetical protein